MARPGRAYKTRHPKKVAFLADYALCGNISRAAKAAAIDRSTVYKWQEHDDLFAAAMRQAELEATETLEEEARRRAHDGTLKPVFQGGELVGHIREYSDTLLIFLLKGLRPDRYRERQSVEHSGPGGRPIQLEHHDTIDLAALSDEELEHLERLVGKAAAGPGGDTD